MEQRLDSYMVNSGLCESREKAKALILNDSVMINHKLCSKPATLVKEHDHVSLCGETLRYVSRGGLKLEKAIKEYNIDLNNKVCADIGASTGGFTDCMLQNGAMLVYSIDVGHDQLAEKLKNNSKVVNMEKTNFRNIKESDIVTKIDFASADVSFISLKLIIPKLSLILSDEGEAVLLIKPQFEAGKSNLSKNGVVKSEAIHKLVLKDIVHFILSSSFTLLGITFSPIKGPKGNIEYLAYVKKTNTVNIEFDYKLTDRVVEEAFRKL